MQDWELPSENVPISSSKKQILNMESIHTSEPVTDKLCLGVAVLSIILIWFKKHLHLVGLLSTMVGDYQNSGPNTKPLSILPNYCDDDLPVVQIPAFCQSLMITGS